MNLALNGLAKCSLRLLNGVRYSFLPVEERQALETLFLSEMARLPTRALIVCTFLRIFNVS